MAGLYSCLTVVLLVDVACFGSSVRSEASEQNAPKLNEIAGCLLLKHTNLHIHLKILRWQQCDCMSSKLKQCGCFSNSGVTTGGMGASEPPILTFRPLLRLAQHSRKVLLLIYRGGCTVYVYCYLLLLTSKETLFGPPLF